MILFFAAQQRPDLLKAEKSNFQCKNCLLPPQKGRLLSINSKRSHLMLLKRLFWATNEHDLLGFIRNLLLAAKALTPTMLFHTLDTEEPTYCKRNLSSGSQRVPVLPGVSVGLPGDGVAIPRGERGKEPNGENPRNVGDRDVAEGNWSGCKRLVSPKLLFYLLVCLGLF